LSQERKTASPWQATSGREKYSLKSDPNSRAIGFKGVGQGGACRKKEKRKGSEQTEKKQNEGELNFALAVAVRHNKEEMGRGRVFESRFKYSETGKKKKSQSEYEPSRNGGRKKGAVGWGMPMNARGYECKSKSRSPPTLTRGSAEGKKSKATSFSPDRQKKKEGFKSGRKKN